MSTPAPETALPCHLCRAPLTRTFVDLGVMPLANSYLSDSELDEPEPRYPLHARVCDECLLVQVEAVVPPERIFRNYAYFSSYSESWVNHARRFSVDASQRLGLGPESFVIEVASNDGYLLRHFIDRGVPVLGIEPAENVAKVASDAGVPTDVRFFTSEMARELVEQGVTADLLVANNVLAHVPDLNDFVGGMALCLKHQGVVSIEIPHLLWLITHVEFDTIYHEHLCYFSLRAVEQLLRAHGLAVFDVQELPTHGGSLRIWASPVKAGRDESARLDALRAAEVDAGLDRIETYASFAERVARCRDSVRAFLAGARAEGKQVVAYGAAAKGNTLLNYCGVSSEDLGYVVDRNPYKQGKFLPGTHLPIRTPDEVFATRPDYLLILAWNLRTEIMDQMSGVRAWGGRFATPVPEIQLYD